MEELKLNIMEELKLKHTYLLQFGSGDILSKVKILLITDKAYHIQWNIGMENNTTWEQKKVFNNNYNMIEDISDFVTEKTEVEDTLHVKIKLVQCHICKGFGTIPDDSITSGVTTCPLCLGVKMISETIET